MPFVLYSSVAIDLVRWLKAIAPKSMTRKIYIQEIISYILLRVFSSENINEPWMNVFFRDGGNHVSEALLFLVQISDFQDKERNVER